MNKLETLELSDFLVQPADMFEQIKKGTKEMRIDVSGEEREIFTKDFLELQKKEITDVISFFDDNYDNLKEFFSYEGKSLPKLEEFKLLKLGFCKNDIGEIVKQLRIIKSREEMKTRDKEALEKNIGVIQSKLRGHGIHGLLEEIEIKEESEAKKITDKLVKLIESIEQMPEINEARTALDNLIDLVDDLEKSTGKLAKFITLLEATDIRRIDKWIGGAKRIREQGRFIEEVEDMNKLAKIINADKMNKLNGVKNNELPDEYNQLTNLIWAINNNVFEKQENDPLI